MNRWKFEVHFPREGYYSKHRTMFDFCLENFGEYSFKQGARWDQKIVFGCQTYYFMEQADASKMMERWGGKLVVRNNDET